MSSSQVSSTFGARVVALVHRRLGFNVLATLFQPDLLASLAEASGEPLAFGAVEVISNRARAKPGRPSGCGYSIGSSTRAEFGAVFLPFAPASLKRVNALMCS